MDACRPVEPERRSAFLEALAAELAALPGDTIGAGTIVQLVRELQKDHWSAPDMGGEPRHGRRRSG